MTLLELLFSPVRLFAWRSDFALIISVGFALAFVAVRAARLRWPRVNERPLLVASALWAILALNEAMARDQGWSFRVDLVFLWPVVLAVTALCVGVVVASIVATTRMPAGTQKED